MSQPAPSESASSPVSKERLRLWLKLLKSSRSVEDEIRRRLRQEYSSTLPRFDVMSALARSPDGLKMSEISKRLRVSNGNITGIVDKLAEDGLAVRVSVPGDRRANKVRLTTKGRADFAEHAEAHENWVDEIFGDLSAADVTDLIRKLDHLNALISKEQGHD